MHLLAFWGYGSDVVPRSRNFADRSVVPWATQRCMLLTSYRRDGSAVGSPVWFVTAHDEVISLTR